MDIFSEDKQYIANTYKRFPLAIKSGNGSILVDIDGKEYIDLSSGIAVNILGACDTQWQQAVTEQMNRIAHTSNLYYTEPQVKLAELLCKKTGMKKVFFGNSGAEANECAIKTARKYSLDKYGAGRSKIVTLKHGFHGRTMATLSATGLDVIHQYFDPFLDGFDYAEPNDIEDTLAKMTDDCAAVMMELIQGEGGVNVLEKEYVKAIAQECEQRDILLVIDEVQTGNGRTGKMYCYEHYDIKPDIVTTAKGIGGGLPIGAVLFGEKTENTLTYGVHGSTFGGNPICAAGAVSVVERLDEKLFDEVTKKGEYVKAELSKLPKVKAVSGMGLMIGIETEIPAADVASKCLEKGLMVLTAKEKVRLLPALNIPFELLEKAISVLSEVLD
ncbi:MAG: aspartate aminotransferase family protein [Oscillospiraceae bacterium]|nr:aspartate aminotransferase family protein [Oscillospiraceae bacterium]